MKTGRTIQELAVELRRREDSKKDFLVPTKKVSFRMNGGRAVEFGDERFDLSRHTQNQIRTYLDMPSKWFNYLGTEHPDILENNLNELFLRREDTRMIRTLDGNARAFLSNRYNRIDNWDVANSILPVLQDVGTEVKIVSCEVTDSRLYLKAVFPRIEGEVKKGDVVRSGFEIENSEIGLGKTVGRPFIERLVCINGMIVPEYGTARRHLGRRISQGEDQYEIFSDDTLRADDRAFLLKMRDTVKAFATEERFGKIVQRMREKAEIQVEGRADKVVEVLAKETKLSEEEQSSVLEHLIKGGDLSQWGVINAVTRTAEDSDSYDRATELEKLGGELLVKDAVFETISKSFS